MIRLRPLSTRGGRGRLQVSGIKRLKELIEAIHAGFEEQVKTS